MTNKKVRLSVDDRYASVYGVGALPIIRQICRARPDGYRFMKRYKQGYWDGYISLMKGMGKFPAGLVPYVREVLEEQGFSVVVQEEVEDDFIPMAVHKTTLHGITLRDYQMDAILELLHAKRGVAKMATNSGKTEVMAGLIASIPRPSVTVLHRTELMYQTAERFRTRLQTDDIGIVGDGKFDVRKHTVAMVQTLYSWAGKKENDISKLFGDNVVVMVDECHHASSPRNMDVIFSIPGQYRYGFSGTPLKHSKLADLKLIAATGPIVCSVSNEYLIVEGYSAKPTIRICVIEDDDEDGWNMRYHEAYEEKIVKNEQRNARIAEFAREAEGVVLILVRHIQHGKILKEMVPGAVFVHGSHATEHRQVVLDKMRTTKQGIFIASPIFDEGVDVPSIDTVILAAGGKSHIKLLQRIGRGMRAKDGGDNSMIVYDFIDDTNKYLLDHSDDRTSVYEQEGFETEIV